DYRPQILSLTPLRFADIWENVRNVAEALGIPESGKELLKALKNRAVDVIEKTSRMKRRPTVACVEWIEPLMAAGNWMPELVEMAGGRNLFGQAGKHSPWMTWDELVASNPEVLFVSPCGFDIRRTLEEMVWLRQRPEWDQLSAVQSGRVFIADGNQYFHRP